MKKLLVTVCVLGAAPGLALAEGSGENLLKIDWALWFWTLLTFLVMMALLVKLAFKPIAAALDRRAQAIRASLDDAEKSRAEGKKLLEGYQQQLAEARTEAKKIIDESKALGENVRQEVVEKANAEATAALHRVQEEIQREKEKSLQELRQTVADLSVQIAGKVIEQQVDPATHRRLIDGLLADLAKLRKV